MLDGSGGGTSGAVDERAVRRNTRWALLAVLVLGVVGVAVGFVVAVVAGDDDGERGRDWVLPVAVAAALLLLTLGLTYLLIRALTRQPAYKAAAGYGWREKRAVHKAVRQGRPLDERETAVARAVLAYTESRVATLNLWIWPAVMVIFVFNGLNQDGVLRWAMLGLAVAYAVLWPVLLLQRRAMIRRYRAALSRSSAA